MDVSNWAAHETGFFMLKGISPIISPELLKIIAEMGHGDELVLSDANFPGTSIGQKCVRCDGHGCAEVMKALLTLFPLDDFVEAPLAVMQVPAGMFPGDKAPIWEAFRAAAQPAGREAGRTQTQKEMRPASGTRTDFLTPSVTPAACQPSAFEMV